MGEVAGDFSLDGMVAFLNERDRPQAVAGTIDVVSAMTERMSDKAVAHFVAGTIVKARGATGRLAQAFQALAPEHDRQWQLLALAEEEVATSEIGREASFSELWQNVEGMLTSYSDEAYVSSEYGRDLTHARTRAVDVERVSDDPPERVRRAGTVNDAQLRGLDHQLPPTSRDRAEDPHRWRDVAKTVATTPTTSCVGY
jgi:hypothetical protein